MASGSWCRPVKSHAFRISWETHTLDYDLTLTRIEEMISHMLHCMDNTFERCAQPPMISEGCTII